MSDLNLRNATSKDVRMKGFRNRTTVPEALAWVDSKTTSLAPEVVDLSQLAGRILTEDIVSPLDIPGFDRAMMDGFAVIAEDSLGASMYNRLPLQVIGQSLPGNAFSNTVKRGEAVKIMTGAPMPRGTDAVLPVEKVEVDNEQIFAQDAVSPGKHVGYRGEDIACGTTILSKGRQLRPQDVGVLASIGARVSVIRKPRVRIVVTGNELLPPGAVPTGSQIVDSNSPMLAAMIQRDGGLAINPGIVADDPDAILEALRDEVDVVLVSGGSSVGQEDYAPMLVAKHGELAIHGIAMRPSSPAGMGLLEKRLVFLLPGNPVACLCAYDFFAARAIRILSGLSTDWPYRSIRCPLRRKLVSKVGRVDYARVELIGEQIEPIAISGASVLSSTTRADGFVVIPGDSEGYPAETELEVYLYER